MLTLLAFCQSTEPAISDTSFASSLKQAISSPTKQPYNLHHLNTHQISPTLLAH